MKKEELFSAIIKQSNILEKIMSFLSFGEGYNLSITCKTALEATKSVKKKGNIWFDEECKVNFYIRSPEEVNGSKLQRREFRRKFMCYPVNRLNFTVDFDENEPTEMIMKAIGQKLNKLLEENQSIKKLNLHFEINFSCDYYIGHLINEIKTDNFPKLEISIFISSWVDIDKFNIPLVEKEVFSGFKNLKEIEMEVKSSHSYDVFNKFVNAASNIEGVAVKIPLRTDKQLEFLLYILNRKVFLVILQSSYSLASLNMWFSKLDIANFAYIQKLCINVRSLTELRDFSNYLPYMENLEYLWIIFYIDEFELEGNININSEIYNYKSSRNLKKLKTIKIEFYHNLLYYDFIPKTLNVREAFLKLLEGSSEASHQNIIKLRIACHKEMFNFLSEIPNSVENLYLLKTSELTCGMTYLLNQYFPKLSLLYLDVIGKAEKECLKNLTNLKYYVCCLVNTLELPNNIRACIVENSDLWCSKGIGKEIYNKCCEFYKELGVFTKEYTLHGSTKGTIFFNYFFDLTCIKNLLDNIP